MCLMIVQVSTHQYQNQSTATISTRRVKGYNRSLQRTVNITTTSATIITKPYLRLRKNKKTHQKTDFNTNKTTPTKATSNITKQSKRKSIKQREKRMRADTQDQKREVQQLQQQQTQQNSTANETAYLVERTNDNEANERESVREQPIYGTWRTKAKRPQVPTVAQTHGVNFSTIAAPTIPTTLAATAAITVGSTEHDDHVYERLPRRSATMMSLRNELHDQLPRPPRLTPRHPSFLGRRQYTETPINASYRDFEQKPKPFHFPFDGPLPAEFKKAKPERAEVNNIEEILQQLHLNGAAPSGATRGPQLVVMPTGLHVAGSFKNFKSSGIANFFRNRRNKKQIQLSFPLQFQPMSIPKAIPLQFYGGYQPPFYNAMAQPYQRIAIDQLHAFKPHSLNEINLLAMQQQLNAKRVKNKKKKIQQILPHASFYGNNNNNNLLLQQSNQRPDHFVPYYPSQWMLMNATKKPQFQRIPFKVNLDIFPVMPPTKAATSLRNPFLNYAPYQYPHALPMQQQQQQIQPQQHQQQQQQIQIQSQQHPQQQQQQFNEVNYVRMPSTNQQQQNQLQHQQFSNNQLKFPDQVPKFTQQQPIQQEPYQRPPLNPQQNSFTPIDFDCIEEPTNENAPPNPNTNQIMLHLNVFPKPRTTATPLPSTNPFYNNINRNNAIDSTTIPSQMTHDTQNLSKQTAYANDTLQQYYPKPQQRNARSDDNYITSVDFQHPIVAADVSDLPQPRALISNKLDTSDTSPYYDHIETRNNFHFDSDSNIDQLSSEARAASLFRYPVKDLIQFQVEDAF